jgi:hypothetical protein
MAKMSTIENRAVGTCQLDDHNEGRIERNLFAVDGGTWEALRFCKNKDGRHNRVHLVIHKEKFVELFRSAVKNGVFGPRTLGELMVILNELPDPFLSVIESISDGTLSQNIDEELYPERPE